MVVSVRESIVTGPTTLLPEAAEYDPDTMPGVAKRPEKEVGTIGVPHISGQNVDALALRALDAVGL